MRMSLKHAFCTLVVFIDVFAIEVNKGRYLLKLS